MKATKSFLFLLSMIFMILLYGCSDEKDGRLSQDPQIVAVKINDVLYSIDNVTQCVDMVNHVATFVLQAGMDLSAVKVEVLATNSAVEQFDNNTIMDVRKPLPLVLKSNDGKNVDWTLRIQSPPKLASFSIEGMNLDMKYVFAGESSLVVQVPEGTDLTALKASITFVNGTVQNFTNGAPLDYTNPLTLEVLGVDGTTVYNFLYIITTDIVGPATIKDMTINGIPVDSVVIDDQNIAMPYIHEFMPDLSNVDVTITTGYGQIVDDSFTGKGLNLISGNPTVNITGTDAVTVTFTIGTPKLVIPALCSVNQTDIAGTINTSVRGAALSGMNVVLSAQAAGAGYVYDFTGAPETPINMATTPAPLWGFHKVASDDEGVMLFSDLGLSAGTYTVFKCDNITSELTPYIQFTGASLGSSTPSYRNASIKIQGKLSGNAIITLSTASTNEVFFWTVTGGVLNTTPKRYTVPYTFSYYWTVTPISADPATNFITTGVANDYNGFIYSQYPSSGNGLSTIFEIDTPNLSECAVTTFNGRIYMAYTYLIGNGAGAQLRVCDITDGTETAFTSPIMDITWDSAIGSIGNATMASDIKVIDGKLYALFMQTSIGFRVYCLNP